MGGWGHTGQIATCNLNLKATHTRLEKKNGDGTADKGGRGEKEMWGGDEVIGGS